MQVDVVPFGGLGNRMRVLNSSFELNKSLKTSLGVIWLVKAELNAPFFTLFKETQHAFSLIKGLKYRLFLPFFKHIYVHRFPHLHKAILGLIYDQILFDDDVFGRSENEILALLKGKKRVLIATCYAFFPFDNFDNFVLSEKLQHRLTELSLPSRAVGIHIRRTDHAEIIKDSSLEKYDIAIAKEISLNPSVTFYLATDDYKVKTHYKQMLGTKLITQNFELSRASSEGVENAIIDIYGLARCTKLICNSKSSFAVAAQKIGSTKEIIEV
ncbi:MAG: hypothetical protein ACI9K1_000172 [Arcticibacterium sp.]|jgi:hypothetical protein